MRCEEPHRIKEFHRATATNKPAQQRQHGQRVRRRGARQRVGRPAYRWQEAGDAGARPPPLDEQRAGHRTDRCAGEHGAAAGSQDDLEEADSPGSHREKRGARRELQPARHAVRAVHGTWFDCPQRRRALSLSCPATPTAPSPSLHFSGWPLRFGPATLHLHMPHHQHPIPPPPKMQTARLAWARCRSSRRRR